MRMVITNQSKASLGVITWLGTDRGNSVVRRMSGIRASTFPLSGNARTGKLRKGAGKSMAALPTEKQYVILLTMLVVEVTQHLVDPGRSSN